MPRVAVILPVFNGERWLRESVASILAQQGVDFELVAVNDGSTDGSGDLLERICSPRLKIVHNPVNIGLIGAINAGLEATGAELIARHDQDDLSLPGRLLAQVRFLDEMPRTLMLGSRGYAMSPVGRVGRRPLPYALTDSDLRFRMFFGNPFMHSSVMLRRHALECVGGYRAQPWGTVPEDYDLWSRLVLHGAVANLIQPFVLYRQHSAGLSRTQSCEIANGSLEVAARYFRESLGPDSDETEFRELFRVLQGKVPGANRFGDMAHKANLVSRLARVSTAVNSGRQEVSKAEVARVIARLAKSYVMRW